MPTIVDTLALELQLDSKQLEKGLSSVVEKVRATRNDYERHAKAFEAVASGLLRALTPIAAALIGITSAIEAIDWSKNAAAATTEFTNLADVIGMSVEQLTAWRQAAEAAGKGGGDALVQSFARQQQTMLTMLPGGTGLKDPEFLRALQRYGMADVSKYLDEKGNLDMDKFNKDLAAASERVDRTAAERAQWMQRLYITHPGQLSLYRNRAALEAELKKQRETVGVINKDNADAMKKLQADWANLESAAENLRIQIVTNLAGPLTHSLETLQKILKYLSDWQAPDWLRWMFTASSPPDWLMRSRTFRALSDWMGFTKSESEGGPPGPPPSPPLGAVGRGGGGATTAPSTPSGGLGAVGRGGAAIPPSTTPTAPATGQPSGGAKWLDTIPPDYKPKSSTPDSSSSGTSVPSVEGGSSGGLPKLPPMPPVGSRSSIDPGLLNFSQTASLYNQGNTFAPSRPSVNTNSNVTIGAMSFHATAKDAMMDYAPSGSDKTLSVGQYSVMANTSLL